MKNNRKYKHGIIVGLMCSIFNKYDPVGFMRMDCPHDEYSGECKHVLKYFLENAEVGIKVSSKGLEREIKRIFLHMMNSEIEVQDQMLVEILDLINRCHYMVFSKKNASYA